MVLDRKPNPQTDINSGNCCSLYLDYILQSCRKIRQFTQGMSFQEFERDVKNTGCVVRDFEVIGEAANRLPEDVKSFYFEVKWAKIIGFCNIRIHAYFGVNLETVRTAIQ
jgi:uncharacterized protein with HEPN domain